MVRRPRIPRLRRRGWHVATTLEHEARHLLRRVARRLESNVVGRSLRRKSQLQSSNKQAVDQWIHYAVSIDVVAVRWRQGIATRAVKLNDDLRGCHARRLGGTGHRCGFVAVAGWAELHEQLAGGTRRDAQSVGHAHEVAGIGAAHDAGVGGKTDILCIARRCKHNDGVRVARRICGYCWEVDRGRCEGVLQRRCRLLQRERRGGDGSCVHFAVVGHLQRPGAVEDRGRS